MSATNAEKNVRSPACEPTVAISQYVLVSESFQDGNVTNLITRHQFQYKPGLFQDLKKWPFVFPEVGERQFSYVVMLV